jgi:hypothetical protein
MDISGLDLAVIFCKHPGCGMLASGIYYDATGSPVVCCTRHIPQPAPEDPCPA